jgi:hypothetical protein
VQTKTPDTTKITVLRQRRGFGEQDLWELWLLDEAEDVPCGSIHIFLHYLCSEGTTHCEIHIARPLARGSVDIRLRGPLADDERNHLLRYQLTGHGLGGGRRLHVYRLGDLRLVYGMCIDVRRGLGKGGFAGGYDRTGPEGSECRSRLGRAGRSEGTVWDGEQGRKGGMCPCSFPFGASGTPRARTLAP